MVVKTNAHISLLFVEDDENTLELLSSMLAVMFPDVTIYTAANGKIGLDLFRTHTPEIVMTDINMPEMCGVKLSENIRLLKPEARIIAISGKSEKNVNNLVDDNELSFDYLIIKPVDISELFMVVEQCIGAIVKGS